jgi:hypothetical protein
LLHGLLAITSRFACGIDFRIDLVHGESIHA